MPIKSICPSHGTCKHIWKEIWVKRIWKELPQPNLPLYLTALPNMIHKYKYLGMSSMCKDTVLDIIQYHSTCQSIAITEGVLAVIKTVHWFTGTWTWVLWADSLLIFTVKSLLTLTFRKFLCKVFLMLTWSFFRILLVYISKILKLKTTGIALLKQNQIKLDEKTKSISLCYNNISHTCLKVLLSKKHSSKFDFDVIITYRKANILLSSKSNWNSFVWGGPFQYWLHVWVCKCFWHCFTRL